MLKIEYVEDNQNLPYNLMTSVLVIAEENKVPTIVKIMGRKYTLAYLQDDDGAN